MFCSFPSPFLISESERFLKGVDSVKLELLFSWVVGDKIVFVPLSYESSSIAKSSVCITTFDFLFCLSNLLLFMSWEISMLGPLIRIVSTLSFEWKSWLLRNSCCTAVLLRPVLWTTPRFSSDFWLLSYSNANLLFCLNFSPANPVW